MKGYDPASLPSPYISADTIPPEWPLIVREIMIRDGLAIRANGLSIEFKSTVDNVWRPVMLPGNGYKFTKAEDRDAILAKIEGR